MKYILPKQFLACFTVFSENLASSLITSLWYILLSSYHVGFFFFCESYSVFQWQSTEHKLFVILNFTHNTKHYISNAHK